MFHPVPLLHCSYSAVLLLRYGYVEARSLWPVGAVEAVVASLLSRAQEVRFSWTTGRANANLAQRQASADGAKQACTLRSHSVTVFDIGCSVPHV